MNINSQIQTKSFLSPNLSIALEIFSLFISKRHFGNVTKIKLLIIVQIPKHNKNGPIWDELKLKFCVFAIGPNTIYATLYSKAKIIAKIILDMIPDSFFFHFIPPRIDLDKLYP